MGIVDISGLHRCGVRMNGVLIEWNSWLGYFYIFHFFYTYVHVTQYKDHIYKMLYPIIHSAVGIQITWIKQKKEYPI